MQNSMCHWNYKEITKMGLPRWDLPNCYQVCSDAVVGNYIVIIVGVARSETRHNTGSGKTLVMIHTLDNFYADPRPKIAIFPKYVVMDNFYLGLLDWPSRWRDYICMRHSSMACTAANSPNWRSVKEQHWQLHLHNQTIEARILEFGEALQAVHEACSRDS